MAPVRVGASQETYPLRIAPVTTRNPPSNRASQKALPIAHPRFSILHMTT